MSSSRTPPLLEPYLAVPPETSLIVLTSILGASTNWLVLRYLHAYLGRRSSSNNRPTAAQQALGVESEAQDDDAAAPGVLLLLVSFLRDYAFWKDGAARLGVDLEAVGRAGRLVYVDGLGALFSPDEEAALEPAARGLDDGRGGDGWRRKLTSATTAHLSAVLGGAVDELGARGGPAGRVVLVVDQLDFVLAATRPQDVSGSALRDLVMGLREVGEIERFYVCGLVDLRRRRYTLRYSRSRRTSRWLLLRRLHWRRSTPLSYCPWPTGPSWCSACDSSIPARPRT